MKHTIYLLNLSTCLLCSLLYAIPCSLQAQTFKLKEPVRGNIQWQSSPDGISWTDIADATQTELNGMDLDGELFYRAKVTDESCEPIYSNVYKTGESSLTQVSFEKVALTGAFWIKRMQIQKERLVPIAFERTKNAVEDLRRTAAFLKGENAPLPSTSRFDISDLFKVMEGAACLLKLERDPKLEQQMDDIIQIIAGAQENDGYLYPAHTTGASQYAEQWGGAGMGNKPYSWVVHSHELYDMGHLYEAAVAYYQATGKVNLLNIAEKSARHINHVFFEGDPKYNNGKPVNQAPGHEEIELALIKLYNSTHNSIYLETAKKFIDIRGVTYKPSGSGVMSPEYAQQHLPVREQREATGHAVRAAYLYSGMADVSKYTGDRTLRPALEAIWNDIVNTRMHITGGLGAVHGIEGFGPQYVLPNADAFDETCAAVGNVFFNYRLFLMEKDGKYMDVAEVALLNNALAGVNLEGDRFFYINPLEHNGIRPFNQGVNGRFEWFGTACCPTNIARLIPQIAGMMYAYAGNEIYCSFYAGSSVDIPLQTGKVTLQQQTDYPFDGQISITVNPDFDGQEFALKLRIPTWAQSQFVPGELYAYADGLTPGWELKVNGQPVSSELEKGFVTISRAWQTGDVAELVLPMPTRFVHASDEVAADRGLVAIVRGPLVYCAEGIDNESDVFSYFVNDLSVSGSLLIPPSGILKDITQITIPARSVKKDATEAAQLTLIPYYAWHNRGASKMKVWLPETEESVRENYYIAPDFIEKVEASHTYQGDGSYGPESPNAIIDGMLPSSSSDTSIPRWTSWPQRGVNQQVTFTFNRLVNIQSFSAYWYEDSDGVKVPVSWNLEYRKDGVWHTFPLYVTDSYSNDKDKFNMVHPGEPTVAEALRLNLTPRSDKTVGILEAIIEEDGN
ncbi:MAG: glycoside hydrolase family 127 protein [Dysgonamonadaceae bacterium]|jgi:DUF1680 family protein|nr:glycoside hydrolase family 127 protein [Dysgonamonadaceae bacterium]